MLIRAEQMTVFATSAEDSFVRRIAQHLLENYAETIVRLPEMESAVKDLPKETLHSLVENNIERARSYELTFESSISAFSALMFEVSPNFDSHRLCQVMLKDEHIEPNDRLDELLEVLTEKNWEAIRGEYDANAWYSKAEEKTETSEENGQSDEAKKIEFAETVMNIETAKTPDNQIVSPVPDFDLTVMNAQVESSKPPAEVKKVDLDATMLSFAIPGKSEKSGKEENFLDTVLNIDLDKE